MTLYDLLEISEKATDKEIKLAYKKLAKKYHPDLNKNNSDMFVRINNAYSILSNPSQKQKYDTMLSTSTAKTFEIFAKGKATPDTYYSESDLWHQQFMNNNQITREWNFSTANDNNDIRFNFGNYNDQFYNQYQSEPKQTSFGNWGNQEFVQSPINQSIGERIDSFLDHEISLLFYSIFKNLKLDNIFFNQLAFREDFISSNLPPQELINFFKIKYNYNEWLSLKHHMNIRIVLEATEIEARTGLEIKVPLNIRVINPNPYHEFWHEKPKNYILNIPPRVKNGEIMEFFNKGHRALGWQGDLIVIIKIVSKINNRVTFLDKENHDYWSLWFKRT